MNLFAMHQAFAALTPAQRELAHDWMLGLAASAVPPEQWQRFLEEALTMAAKIDVRRPPRRAEERKVVEEFKRQAAHDVEELPDEVSPANPLHQSRPRLQTSAEAVR